MGLKNIYYFFENKWYDFVEKVGLYKITDKIDKVMPSFLLFILLVIMLIAGLFLALPAIQGKGEVPVSFMVLDDQGNSVPLAPIQVSSATDNYTLTTDDYGSTDTIYLKKGSEISVDIDYSGSNYDKYFNNYVVDDEMEITIYLDSTGITSEMTRYNFSLVDAATNASITSDGTITFSCRNFGGQSPGTVNVINGEVNVEADSGCQLVAQSISVDGYETTYSQAITQQTQIIG